MNNSKASVFMQHTAGEKNIGVTDKKLMQF